MHNIVEYFKQYFLQKEEYFQAFIQNDTRVEGWFKAELLVLLNKMKKDGIIRGYITEANLYLGDEKRFQVDFFIGFGQSEHCVELKALCISQSKGSRNLHFYFRSENAQLIKDFSKLDVLSEPNKWVMAFVYPKPSAALWNYEANNIRGWKCITNLEDYPDYFFIALFKKEN